MEKDEVGIPVPAFISCQMLLLQLLIDHMILSFVNVVHYIDRFAYIESFLCPWNEPHLTVMYYLFDVYIQLATILFMIFASIFIRDIHHQAYSCVCVHACMCVYYPCHVSVSK